LGRVQEFESPQIVNHLVPVFLIVLLAAPHEGVIAGRVLEEAKVLQVWEAGGDFGQEGVDLLNVVVVEAERFQAREGRELDLVPEIVIVQNQRLEFHKKIQPLGITEGVGSQPSKLIMKEELRRGAKRAVRR